MFGSQARFLRDRVNVAGESREYAWVALPSGEHHS
jgi:hypothetical protein